MRRRSALPVKYRAHAMSRPGFSFCVCPDSELVRERVQHELSSHESSWRKRTFWGDEELPQSYWQFFHYRALFGETTALVLRRAENLSAPTWKEISNLLQRHRRQVWPFFTIESEWSRKDPPVPAALSQRKCWRLALERGWVWKSPGLDQRGLRHYIQQWARERGIEVDEEFMHRALELLPLHAGLVKRELEKLELWARDKKILTRQDAGHFSVEPEMDVFQFLGCLQRGESLAVWKRVVQSRMESDPSMFLPFLHLLLREARILWQLLHQEEVKLPSSIKRQKQALASSMGTERLSRLWTHVLEAEVGLKSGEWSQAQALNILLSHLESAFSGKTALGRG